MRAFVVAGKAPTSSVLATGLPGSEGGTDDSVTVPKCRNTVLN
jgi:hypothetical protein